MVLTVRTAPDLKGIVMHNQVLILMHRVVTAEQYTMARHALLLMPVEPPTRAFGDAM